jgi:hypothetical protein
MVRMNRRTHEFRANGAAFIDSLGQCPRIHEPEYPSAQSAAHYRVESRLQRFIDNCLPGFPGALPEADLIRAPLALERWRRILISFFCVLALGVTVAGFAQDEEEASNAKPDAGGVVIEPSRGKIAEGDTITITFPVSMVAAELIDVGDQPSPFVSEPKLDGTFLWKSQTEGVFTVSGVVAEARHRLTLAPGLKDATGKPFVVKVWSAEFRTPKFAITTEFSERKYISNQPMRFASMKRRSTFTFKTASRAGVFQSK